MRRRDTQGGQAQADRGCVDPNCSWQGGHCRSTQKHADAPRFQMSRQPLFLFNSVTGARRWQTVVASTGTAIPPWLDIRWVKVPLTSTSDLLRRETWQYGSFIKTRAFVEAGTFSAVVSIEAGTLGAVVSIEAAPSTDLGQMIFGSTRAGVSIPLLRPAHRMRTSPRHHDQSDPPDLQPWSPADRRMVAEWSPTGRAGLAHWLGSHNKYAG
ncbi:uncharacterized protein BJ171DRAFT_514040 [Polychytrium aggregatum]|uniref:uncharacterized protein n=1 Tax=Polychytrium aggregatum TaxID=110093 RepID=UPI0022FE5C90|nr:uncharacterized protein BJ171DRAFT_514040 [Polychytrium aggregatum]KAI9202427.1 hypothetical protein BJ171DRAFT_514040 [Polychytrium aggregatum]